MEQVCYDSPAEDLATLPAVPTLPFGTTVSASCAPFADPRGLHFKEVEYQSRLLQKTLQVLRADVCDLEKVADQDVYVHLSGWIQVSRLQGKIAFLYLRDGTGYLQVMIPKPVMTLYKEQIPDLRREAAVSVVGTIHTDARAPTGIELRACDFDVVGKSAEITQINDDTKSHDLLDHRHLVLREERGSATMKVRHYTQKFLREFFDQERCYEVTPPTLTQSECEGGSSVFRLKYFDQEASLTQSSQLYLETAIPFMKRVFCILPSFRAEKSRTRRHLTEYSHIEVELAFITFEDLLSFIERMIVHVCQRLIEDPEAGGLIAKLNPKFTVPSLPFKRMKYSDAIVFLREHDIYKDADTKTYYVYGDDIPEAPERKMVDMIGSPVFMTHFPRAQKAFYMDPTSDGETYSADLLYPGVGEIVGSSMRLWDHEKLMEGFALNKIDPKPYAYYIDQRRYGTCPHGGFGLGLERLVMCIADLESVKEACLFPRFVGRVTP